MDGRQHDAEQLTPGECLALLRTTNIGRIAYSERALPAIAAVTFALVDDTLILRADERSPVATAVRNTVVAFHADGTDASGATAWSVTCVGQARPVTESAEVDFLAELDNWPTDAVSRPEFLRIEPELLTGRRSYGPLTRRARPLVSPVAAPAS